MEPTLVSEPLPDGPNAQCASRHPGGLRRWMAVAGVAVALIGLAAGGLSAQERQAVSATLAEADKLYDEKSYGGALEAYKALLAGGRVQAARKDDVAYRVAVCLGKAQKWDAALAQGLDFVKERRDTVWEPRGLYWLGRLYLGVPHNGWSVGKGDAKTVHRGNDVPQTELADKPEQVFLGEQDLQNSLDALEAARVYFPKFRAERKTESDEVQLNFDLARSVQGAPQWSKWLQSQAWRKPEDAYWEADPAQPYDVKWDPPKKLMYLYDQVEALAPKTSNPTRTGLLATFGKALWLRSYHQMMLSAAVKYENGKPIRIPYPYEGVGWEPMLRRMAKGNGEEALRDHAAYTIAMFLMQEGRNKEALAEYRRFLEERPNSKWVEDAKFAIQQITRKGVSVYVQQNVLPEKPHKATVYYRNTPTLHLEVFRVKLEQVIGRPERLNDPAENWQDFRAQFGKLADARRFYGPSVKSWDVPGKDIGDYQQHTLEVEVPVKESGAYVLEVSSPGVRSATLLIVSDLALMTKVHRDGGLFFVTDAITGKPAADVELLAKQWWWEGGSNHSAASRVKTNSDGIASVPLQRGPNRTGFRIGALAYTGPRYAVTWPMYSNDVGDNPFTYQVYTVTDRAVYRPLQTVFYRQMVMKRERGEVKPVANEQVRVTVNDPQGKAIHTEFGTSNEFGTVSGSFSLADGAPLGEYYVNVAIPQKEIGPTQFGGNRFRVEEYKKPEFQVEVTPEAERIKLGQPTTAKVKASYYFGGPVPGAKVTYRVYRNWWAQQYQFPRPFDFLYRWDRSGDYNTYFRNGQVVQQGEAKTDVNGEAKVSFPTAVDPAQFGSQDAAFTIEADVQDASRRTISGTGSVKATRHDVAVFLDFKHGYATQGDRVDVEVITLNPSDQPVSVSGKARVYRQPATPDQKEKLVWEEALKTDKEGRGYIRWKNDASGYYRIAFETADSAGEAVAGSTFVFVNGPELEHGRFLFRNMALQVENLYYEEGQTAKVLLVTPEPDCTVLFTREANNEITSRQVLHVKGRSLELKLQIDPKDVPNFYISAVMIRGGQFYQATQELFVPPVRRFAKVTVEADKERYEPGQKAKFKLHAADWQGKPLRTELSIAVTDASLAYIQKDYAPDPRVYYYGNRRSQSINSTLSNAFSFNGLYEDDQPNGQFKTHQWLLPDGMGALTDWPGEQSGFTVFDFDGMGRNHFYSNGLGVSRDGRFAGGFGGLGGGGGGFAALSARGERGAAGPAGAPMAAMAKSGSVDRKFDLAERAKDKNEAREESPGNDGTRKNFADTAFWTPTVRTDDRGNATVEVLWPDNLTQWRAYGIGTSQLAQVGSGETKVRTKKDLLVRLQAPRFFVERDKVTVSCDVHNYTDREQMVKVRMELTGDTAQTMPAGPYKRLPEPTTVVETVVSVAKDAEKRLDWPVTVLREGTLGVKVSAQTQDRSDATQMSFPVLVHGVERATAAGGVMRQENTASLAIQLPAERKPGSSELVVQLNPSLGATMLDALPYLLEYPYGCIEQTTSRFLPAVVVAKTLKDLGTDLTALKKRAEAMELKLKENDKAQPGGKTVANSPYWYPKGRPGTVRVPDLAQWRKRIHSPVFDPAELDGMVRQGLERIAGFQHADGGWGWWPADSSDPYMSTYVLYALITAKEAGHAVDQGMLDRGLAFLKGHFAEDENLHRTAYSARVLGMAPQMRDAIKPLVTGRMFDRRERLSTLSKSYLAIALNEVGDKEKAEVVLRNIETTARLDEANGTVSWEESPGGWWCWWNNRVETNAGVLQAFEAIRPEAKLPALMVKWMVNNRRSNTWGSTRETAMAVYALADYVRVNKELEADYSLTVDLGNRVKRQYHVTRDNALLFDNQFIVPDELLESGTNTLSLTKEGEGTLYYSAYTRYFSLEEPIKATGNEVYVHRKYFRLVPGTASGQPEQKPLDLERPNPFLTGQYELLTVGGEWTGYQDTDGGPRYDRQALKDGDTLTSGDQVEVELQLESKNDYEYLVFEDFKPAGCEPVELRSGGKAGLGVYSNVEFRDQKVAFFLTSLPQGKRTLTYRLRAEIPGQFHALPTNGYAMYAPDIRCLSDETRLTIKDAG